MRVFAFWLLALLSAIGCAFTKGVHMKFEVGAGEKHEVLTPALKTTNTPSFPDPIINP